MRLLQGTHWGLQVTWQHCPSGVSGCIAASLKCLPAGMAPAIRHHGCLLALRALEAESLTRAAMGFLRSGDGCFSSAAGALA